MLKGEGEGEGVSCTTDECNNDATSLQTFKSLILEENLAQLNILFHNRSAVFTKKIHIFTSSIRHIRI